MASYDQRLHEDELGFFVADFDNDNAPGPDSTAGSGSDSDGSPALPPKRRLTNPAGEAARVPPVSARARRVRDAAPWQVAAAAAEAALEAQMAHYGCSDEEEILQIALAVSMHQAPAVQPAPRVNIRGFSASGTPPVSTHIQFSDASGDGACDGDGEGDDGDGDHGGDDDDGDDDDNATSSPATAGLFHGILDHPAIAAMVGQIPSPDLAAAVDTATTTPAPPSPPLYPPPTP